MDWPLVLSVIFCFYGIGMLLVGAPMGLISIRIWADEQRKKGISELFSSGGFWEYILFPTCSYQQGVGLNGGLFAPNWISEVDFNDYISIERYFYKTCLMWPFRLLWIAIFVPLLTIARLTRL